jgi:hypothetical protein
MALKLKNLFVGHVQVFIKHGLETSHHNVLECYCAVCLPYRGIGVIVTIFWRLSDHSILS